MGPSAALEMDAWLRNGGLVVTASDRAARALASAFHRARRAEGLTAWPAPRIQDWNSFVRSVWEEQTRGAADPRLLLNPIQEQALWAEIAGNHNHLPTLLEGPRHRLASLAMDAHKLICGYAPRMLKKEVRGAWQQDAGAFSNWLAAFDEACRDGNLLSPARLPLELTALLHVTPSQRPPLLLAGFDRILPVQREQFNAWGTWRQAESGSPAAEVHFYEAPDSRTELAACVLWCGQRLAANPHARLLVVTQDASVRRGEIERAFLQLNAGPVRTPLFEFSLGVPLSQVTLPRAAHLLLRWLSGPIAEHEVDWLISTCYLGSAQETSALQAAMLSIRRRGREQPQWKLKSFLSELQPNNGIRRSCPELEAWASRMAETQRRLEGPREDARRMQSPLEWAELAPRLLESARFAGSSALSSAEFQAHKRWRQAVEICGSLGFDGRRMAWAEFLPTMARTLESTLFAPESRDAPIVIAGPAESAGLTADAIWFLGADEDKWPVAGSTNPLLPLEVQRQAEMPHAAPRLDWDLALSVTMRVLASAPEVHFSYARQNEAVELRPSRLIVQLAGQPCLLTPELTLPPSPPPITFSIEDSRRIPFPPGTLRGGAAVLTSQSQCPFKGFATARLGAKSWDPAEAGLTHLQRGNLLHEVLHSIWGDQRDKIWSFTQLQEVAGDTSFVMRHVQRILDVEVSPQLRERMHRRYLELEAQRLTGLVAEWLSYEAARVAFEVAETEANRDVEIEGIRFKLRLDRIDRLNDGSLLVIDYKTGNVSLRYWDLPRPEDVQLPLYAGFALDREREELGGLVFAKVQPGKLAFEGRVFDPSANVFSGLKSTSGLAKNALTLELLEDWRGKIEELARDFLDGDAKVDPREYPKTCERCGLQTLCRIQENRAALDAEDESEDEEAADD
jgi:probable DNA repair protein